MRRASERQSGKRKREGHSPTESNRDNSGAVLGDLEKHGHGKVEVGTRRVTPAAIVAGKSVVRWAEVGGGDEDGGAAGVAPLGVVGALDLKASATAEPAVEQCGAQCCRVDSVALAVEIPIPTSTPCTHKAISHPYSFKTRLLCFCCKNRAPPWSPEKCRPWVEECDAAELECLVIG